MNLLITTPAYVYLTRGKWGSNEKSRLRISIHYIERRRMCEYAPIESADSVSIFPSHSTYVVAVILRPYYETATYCE